MRRTIVAVITAMLVLAGFASAGPAIGAGNSGATITGEFSDRCTDFEATSSKEISHVEIFYADGIVVKDESLGTHTYELEGDETITKIIVKAGTSKATFTCTMPECSDGFDNGDPEDANDPKFDADDLGCHSGPNNTYDPEDPDETNPQCSDGVDNEDPEDEGDPLADSDDPGCINDGVYDPYDNDETDGPGPKPECSDGFDNGDPEDANDPKFDADDLGCHSGPNNTYDPEDPDETNPQCSDGVDNEDPEDEGDPLADSDDPGCINDGVYDPYDNDETDEPGPSGARFTCRASALRIEGNVLLETLLGEAGMPFEPVVANGENDPCADDTESTFEEELSDDALGSIAVTVQAVSTGAGDGAEANAGTTLVTISGATGPVAVIEVITASATGECVDGSPVLSASSVVASVTVGDETYETPDEGPITIPGVGVLHLDHRESGETVDGETYLARRAVYLDGEAPVGDVIVGESRVGHYGNPCE